MNALDNANITDKNCIGFASFAFPEAKSSKTGVSVEYAPREDKEWYVLRINYIPPHFLELQPFKEYFVYLQLVVILA